MERQIRQGKGAEGDPEELFNQNQLYFSPLYMTFRDGYSTFSLSSILREYT